MWFIPFSCFRRYSIDLITGRISYLFALVIACLMSFYFSICFINFSVLPLSFYKHFSSFVYSYFGYYATSQQYIWWMFLFASCLVFVINPNKLPYSIRYAVVIFCVEIKLFLDFDIPWITYFKFDKHFMNFISWSKNIDEKAFDP